MEVPPVGLAGAARLARPGSIWAQLFYRGDHEKLERARKRFDPQTALIERFRIPSPTWSADLTSLRLRRVGPRHPLATSPRKKTRHAPSSATNSYTADTTIARTTGVQP